MSGEPGGQPRRRAQVVGTGLIGGSVAAALRRAGWHVTGDDVDASRAAAAQEMGVIDATGRDDRAELCVVAVPVGGVAEVAREVLASTDAVVTDVGSVKAPVVAAVGHPRFVGGHPMAGSEQEGVAGSRADMFDGAVWVLTPDRDTDPAAFTAVHRAVASLGADVITLDPAAHDEVVATVSHVPHLAAVTLMDLAADRADERAALLRLAAGGFRDMTRIAAGHPGIWPDICAENRTAILGVLDDLIGSLSEVRRAVDGGDRAALLARLERARAARINLPVTAGPPQDLAEVRVRIPDLPGQIEVVARHANQAGINIYDIEIAHSAGGVGGVLIAVVAAQAAGDLQKVLVDDGYAASVGTLG